MRSKSLNFEQTSCKDIIHPVSTNSLSKRRQQLKQWLHQCRLGTLTLFEGIDYNTFCYHAHPDFSPVGWHLGHIAYTESLWLLERSAGIAPLFPEYRRLFVADGLPKNERVNLPTLEEVRHYLDTVRENVWHYLETADLDKEERLWRWLIQHESQHSETIAFVLQLQNSLASRESKVRRQENLVVSLTPNLDEMIEIPAGYFEQGNNSIDALDNERPEHQVYLDTYWIDRYGVTCGQYQEFMAAGGYQKRDLWSDEGWEWLQSQQLTKPLYWSDDPYWENHPVCGVSWYEAEAYARFVGKRLPTEAEWEKAASWDSQMRCRRLYPWGDAHPDNNRCNYNNVAGQTMPVNVYPNGQSAYGLYDTLGNVWEWTASIFQGYEGFINYPYSGYSKVYFDGEHYVLKGGSWATFPWALRCSFRNWYYPQVRQILAGFRCAKSGD